MVSMYFGVGYIYNIVGYGFNMYFGRWELGCKCVLRKNDMFNMVLFDLICSI
jgi:hypothetical protein